jgi:hypothetical protein
MMALRVLRALGLSFVMAALLAIVGSILAPEDQEDLFSSLFFFIGLTGFFILLLKAGRAGFWFCLCFAIEWALLPVAAAINTTQPVKETGCAGAVAAIGTALLLIITIPIGAIGFLLFLLLALQVFRKREPHAAKPSVS